MVSPLGSDTKSSWDAMIQGQSGIKYIKDLQEYKDDNNYPNCAIAPIHESFDKKKWEVAVRIS